MLQERKHTWLRRITWFFYIEEALAFSVTYLTLAFVRDKHGCF